MKQIRLIVAVLFALQMNAEPLTDSYLKDLEEQGYCVIPDVLSTVEAEQLYQRVWHEFIEKAWPNCRLDDRSNWKDTFPMHDKYGIFAGPAGHIQVLWDLRQDSRIVDIFSQIWNTKDLVVSMDGLSLMCPPEIRKGGFDPWPHVDQVITKKQTCLINKNCPPSDFVSESSLKTNPFNIQGQFLFEDSSEGDGGFYCIPKSHLRFNEFAPQLKEEPNVESWKYNNEFLMKFFNLSKEDESSQYCMKHITASKGSLILWDSRTVHWNQYASEKRPYRKNPKVRMVGYLLYLPKTRLTDEAKKLRKECFERGISTTGAIPTSFSDLKHTKDYIGQEYLKYLEDSHYIPQKVSLTKLGESLLGY